jgi:ribonuclease P/MRP protein subunit POP1
MQEAMKSAKYVNVLRIALRLSPRLNRAGSTHRAWQELPRHLRRRAASHNVRRVPLRLRRKSRAEVSDPTCIYIYILLILPQRWILGAEKSWDGRSRNSERADENIVVKLLNGDNVGERNSALHRVLIVLEDKKWLETHLWHAKRMHMEKMWGYRLVRAYN